LLASRVVAAAEPAQAWVSGFARQFVA